MGYNTNCAASNQTISSDELSYLALCVQRIQVSVEGGPQPPVLQGVDSTIGPFSYWQPISLFLEGYFEDGLFMGLSENAHNDRAFRRLCATLMNVKMSNGQAFCTYFEECSPSVLAAIKDVECRKVVLEPAIIEDVWQVIAEHLFADQIHLPQTAFGGPKGQVQTTCLVRPHIICSQAYQNLLEFGLMNEPSDKYVPILSAMVSNNLHRTLGDFKPEEGVELRQAVIHSTLLSLDELMGDNALGLAVYSRAYALRHSIQNVNSQLVAQMLSEGAITPAVRSHFEHLVENLSIYSAYMKLGIQVVPSSYRRLEDGDLGTDYSRFINMVVAKRMRAANR